MCGRVPHVALQDALAFGKTEAQCVAEGVPAELVSHKVFEGNRPSTQILIGEMTPFTVCVPCSYRSPSWPFSMVSCQLC